MAGKKTSILSALEGGHLDGSLFGRVLSRTQDQEKDNEQAQLPGRQRRGWRLKGFTKSRKQTRRKTRSDPGL